MLTDLRYALGQLRPVAAAVAKQVPSVGAMPAVEVEDRLSLAIGALERCIEAVSKPADAELDAIFADSEEPDLIEAQSRGPGWTR